MISPISPAQYLDLIMKTNAMNLNDVVKTTSLMACTIRGILNTSTKVDRLNATGLGRLPAPIGYTKYTRKDFHAQKWLRIQQTWDDYNYVPPQNEPVILTDRPSLEDKLKPTFDDIREKILSWSK